MYKIDDKNNLELDLAILSALLKGNPESIERFSFECCKTKTKTKVITLANHKEHRQYSEPIKTRNNYM